MPIVEALQAISSSLGILKEFQAMRKEWDDATFKLKIAELTTTLADAKMALVDARETIEERDGEITKLKEAFKSKEALVDAYGYRYRILDGKPVGHAMCTVCELDGVLIAIEKTTIPNKFNCPRCKAGFSNVPEFTYPPGAQRNAHLVSDSPKVDL